MTFLEFVAERLMGPPVSRSGGRSVWHCPFHQDNHPSFSTLPTKPEYKDRYRCFSCGAWGDEYDLLKLFYDRENFADRKDRLDKWRQDWQREAQPEPVVFSPVDRGETQKQSMVCSKCSVGMDQRELRDLVSREEFSPQAEDAAGALLKYLGKPPSVRTFRKLMKFAQKALEICAQHGLLPASFAGRVGFEEWTRGMDMEHVAEVGVSLADCDAATCRASRCRQHRVRRVVKRGVKG